MIRTVLSGIIIQYCYFNNKRSFGSYLHLNNIYFSNPSLERLIRLLIIRIITIMYLTLKKCKNDARINIQIIYGMTHSSTRTRFLPSFRISRFNDFYQLPINLLLPRLEFVYYIKSMFSNFAAHNKYRKYVPLIFHIYIFLLSLKNNLRLRNGF